MSEVKGGGSLILAEPEDLNRYSEFCNNASGGRDYYIVEVYRVLNEQMSDLG